MYQITGNMAASKLACMAFMASVALLLALSTFSSAQTANPSSQEHISTVNTDGQDAIGGDLMARVLGDYGRHRRLYGHYWPHWGWRSYWPHWGWRGHWGYWGWRGHWGLRARRGLVEDYGKGGEGTVAAGGVGGGSADNDLGLDREAAGKGGSSSGYEIGRGGGDNYERIGMHGSGGGEIPAPGNYQCKPQNCIGKDCDEFMIHLDEVYTEGNH